jgi:hypothetical protein
LNHRHFSSSMTPALTVNSASVPGSGVSGEPAISNSNGSWPTRFQPPAPFVSIVVLTGDAVTPLTTPQLT